MNREFGGVGMWRVGNPSLARVLLSVKGNFQLNVELQFIFLVFQGHLDSYLIFSLKVNHHILKQKMAIVHLATPNKRIVVLKDSMRSCH